jgi:hypothetical protein
LFFSWFFVWLIFKIFRGQLLPMLCRFEMAGS